MKEETLNNNWPALVISEDRRCFLFGEPYPWSWDQAHKQLTMGWRTWWGKQDYIIQPSRSTLHDALK